MFGSGDLTGLVDVNGWGNRWFRKLNPNVT